VTLMTLRCQETFSFEEDSTLATTAAPPAQPIVVADLGLDSGEDLTGLGYTTLFDRSGPRLSARPIAGAAQPIVVAELGHGGPAAAAGPASAAVEGRLLEMGFTAEQVAFAQRTVPGMSLHEAVDFLSNNSAPVGSRICPSCGRNNDGHGGRFCGGCGATL